jgi:hypothetical protein
MLHRLLKHGASMYISYCTRTSDMWQLFWFYVARDLLLYCKGVSTYVTYTYLVLNSFALMLDDLFLMVCVHDVAYLLLLWIK